MITQHLFSDKLTLLCLFILIFTSSIGQDLGDIEEALRPFFNNEHFNLDTDISSEPDGGGTILSTKARFFDIDGIDLSTRFVGEFELESITAIFPTAKNLTLNKFLESMAGDIASQLDTPLTKKLLKQIPVPLVNFIVIPNDKRILFFSKDPENPELSIAKEEDGFHFTIQYAPPPGFKFTEIDTALKALDDINVMDQIKLSITNESDDNSGNGKKAPLKIGVTSNFKATNFLKKSLNTDPFPKASFTGFIDSNFNLAFGADLALNIDLGNDVTFEGVGVSITKETASIQFMMDGSMVIPVDNQLLRMALGLVLEPTGPALSGTFDLTSVGDIDSGIVEWQEPFGIPNFTFLAIGGNIGGNAATLVDNVGLRADIKLGRMPKDPNKDKRIVGKMDTHLDVNLSQSQYNIQIDNLTLLGIVEAFKEEGYTIPKDVEQFLKTGINNAEIELDPANKQFSIKGDASFLDFVNGSVDIEVGDGGFLFSGDLDPILLTHGGIDVLGVHAKGDEKKGVNFTVGMVGAPIIDMSGGISLFGSELSGAEMKIDDKGIFLQADANLGDFTNGSLTIKGTDVVNSRRLNIGLVANPPDIKEEVTSFVSDNAGSIAGEMVDFVMPQFGIKSMVFTSTLDKFTNGVTAKVDFYAGLAGKVKHRSLNIELDYDFNSPEKIAASTATIIAAISEQLIYVFGDVAEIVFEVTLEAAEQTIETLVEGAEIIAKEAEQAAATVGKAFEYLGNEVLKLVTPRTFPGAKYKGEAQTIKPGYRHYELQLSASGYGNEKYYGSLGMSVHKPGYGPGSYKEEKFLGDVLDAIESAVISKYVPKYKPANAYVDQGDNLFLIGRNEDNSRKWDSFLQNKKGGVTSKHFYVKDTEDASITVNGLIYRVDFGLFDADDSFNRTIGYNNISNRPSKRFWDRSFVFNIDNGKLKIKGKLIAHPMMTGDLLLADIRNNKNDALIEKIKKGGDIKAIGNEAVKVAIENKNKEVLAFLKSIDVKTTLDTFNRIVENDSDDDILLLVFNMLDNYNNLRSENIQSLLLANKPWMANLMLLKSVPVSNENLSTALDRRAYKFARDIIERGLKPGRIDLEAAVKKGDQKAVSICLSYLEPTSEMFITAARSNFTEVFRQLHSKTPKLANDIEIANAAIDVNNMTILKLALKEGLDAKELMIKSISLSKINAVVAIDEVSSIDYSDPAYLFTAIDYSKRGSHRDIAAYLLEKGANPNTYVDSITGNTLLHIVSERRRKNKYAHRIQLGLINGKPFYFPIVFKLRRDYKLMDILISNGADLDVKNNKGWTPLHYAADRARNKRSRRLVEMMVEKGADVNACTHKNRTVLKEANGRKNKKYLKSQGARKKGCSESIQQ